MEKCKPPQAHIQLPLLEQNCYLKLPTSIFRHCPCLKGLQQLTLLAFPLHAELSESKLSFGEKMRLQTLQLVGGWCDQKAPPPPTVGNSVKLFLFFFCLQTAKFFCVTSIANKLVIVGCPKPAMMSDHTKTEFWCTFGELQKQNPLMNSIKLLKR